MKNENLAREQKKTKNNVVRLLKRYSKCLLIRPTGFGKTYLSVNIMKNYKNVVFLYPSHAIGNSIKEDVKNSGLDSVKAHFYTYHTFREMYKRHDNFLQVFSKLNNKNTLFVLDEAHVLAAPVTSKAILELMNVVCPNANYLGMTATPIRTDKLEIKWHYFDGNTPYEYTISNAIEDGLYVKPYYVYIPMKNIAEYFYDRIDTLDVSPSKKNQLRDRVQQSINPQEYNITNLDEILSKNLHKFYNENGYYKFILFFTTYADIERKHDEIVSAFSKVFPMCEINTVRVTSESVEHKSNLKKIEKLHERPNTIDLIFNINMLNMGYHKKDITGIIMYRHTVSNIIYTQQVGRCLDVTKTKASIIFDLVDNVSDNMRDYAVKIEGDNRVRLNQFDPLFNSKDVNVDDETAEIMEINRLINNAIKEEFEEEVVKAYRLGLVSINYCIAKLELQDAEDFYKILEVY